MPIKCGRGHYHESVAEVRACYNVPAEGGPRIHPNKYPGTCIKCQEPVKAEHGRIDRNDSGKFDVSHLDGQCPPRDMYVGNVPKTPAPKFSSASDFDKIPAGHYATKSLTGRQDFDFWRVDRPEHGAYAGRIFVKRILGGKPEMNVSRVTRIAALQAILDEGTDVTGFRYGQQLGRCRHCNRTLTDQLSRELSAGPECRSKH